MQKLFYVMQAENWSENVFDFLYIAYSVKFKHYFQQLSWEESI